MLAACDYRLSALFPFTPLPFPAPIIPSSRLAMDRNIRAMLRAREYLDQYGNHPDFVFIDED